MAIESSLDDTVIVSSAFPSANRLSSLMAVATISRPAPKHLRAEVEVAKLPDDAYNSKELVRGFDEIHDSLFVSEEYFQSERERIAVEKAAKLEELAEKEAEYSGALTSHDGITSKLDRTATNLFESRETILDSVEESMVAIYGLAGNDVAVPATRLNECANEAVAPITSPEYAAELAKYNRYARAEVLLWNAFVRSSKRLNDLRGEISRLKDTVEQLKAELAELEKDEVRYTARLEKARDVLTMNTRPDRALRAVRNMGNRVLSVFNPPEAPMSKPVVVNLELLPVEQELTDEQ